MFTRSHYYHQTLKKTVTLFGTCFNNITIGRTSNAGVISNVERVPIAYGPKQKFLARITEQPDLGADKVAIKVPRMSFEITTVAYDPSRKLGKLNRIQGASSASSSAVDTTWQAVPYKIGFQLSIYGRNQDDVLQVVEQILPEFTPEYVIQVNDMIAPGYVTNVPIILTGVTPANEYEGDLSTQRRTVIATLDFEVKVSFYGPVVQARPIRFVEISLRSDDGATQYLHTSVSSPEDTILDYTPVSTIDDFGFSDGYISLGLSETVDSTRIFADSTTLTADNSTLP